MDYADRKSEAVAVCRECQEYGARLAALTEALTFIAEGRVPSGRDRIYAREALVGEA